MNDRYRGGTGEDPMTDVLHERALKAEAEVDRLRSGFCDEAYILMVQALGVKALPKGRKRILTEQAIRMAKVGLSQGWPRYPPRDPQRYARDVLAALLPASSEEQA